MQGHADSAHSGTIAFLIGWAVAVAHVGIAKYVMRRLEQRHRATWMGLGSPGIFMGGNARNAYLLWRFMTFSGHRALRDETLDLICLADTVLQLIFLPLFVTSIYLLGSEAHTPKHPTGSLAKDSNNEKSWPTSASSPK